MRKCKIGLLLLLCICFCMGGLVSCSSEKLSVRLKMYNMECSVEIPDDWEGKYLIEETETGNSVHFIHKATYDKYGAGSGSIFYLVSENPADIELEEYNGFTMLKDSPVPLKLVLEKSDKMIFCGEPTDVQCPAEWEENPDAEIAAIAKEYREMCEDMEVICETAKWE